MSHQILGTGVTIGGEPAIDEEDAEYKLSLSDHELSSLLDDEDYAAKQALDKEREEDEKAVSIFEIKHLIYQDDDDDVFGELSWY